MTVLAAEAVGAEAGAAGAAGASGAAEGAGARAASTAAKSGTAAPAMGSKPKKPGASAAPAPQSKKGGKGKGRSKALLNGDRRVLMAEFLACAVILFAAGVLQTDPKLAGSNIAKRGTGLCGLFLVLALLSAGGKGAAKVANSFGFVVLLAYMFNERAVFAKIAAVAKKAQPKKADTGGVAEGEEI